WAKSSTDTAVGVPDGFHGELALLKGRRRLMTVVGNVLPPQRVQVTQVCSSCSSSLCCRVHHRYLIRPSSGSGLPATDGPGSRGRDRGSGDSGDEDADQGNDGAHARHAVAGPGSRKTQLPDRRAARGDPVGRGRAGWRPVVDGERDHGGGTSGVSIIGAG